MVCDDSDRLCHMWCFASLRSDAQGPRTEPGTKYASTPSMNRAGPHCEVQVGLKLVMLLPPPQVLGVKADHHAMLLLY